SRGRWRAVASGRGDRQHWRRLPDALRLLPRRRFQRPYDSPDHGDERGQPHGSLIICRPPCASPMMADMATTRRADMFIDLEDDPRENGPTLGDERTTLVEALRCARLTFEMKCSDLDAEAMAQRSIEPSTMSLLGLVR